MTRVSRKYRLATSPWTSAHSRWRRPSSSGRSSSASSTRRNSSSARHRPSASTGVVVDTGAADARIELSEPALGGGERVEHGTGEQPVEEEELDRRRRVDRVPVRAQVGLVGRAAAQRRGPPRRPQRLGVPRARAAVRSCRRARGCDRARGTTTPRRGSASSRRGRRASAARSFTQPKKSWRGRTARRSGRASARLAVGRVERLPHLRRDRFAGATGVLPRRGDRATRSTPRTSGPA